MPTPTLILHGTYTADGNFNLSSITGDTGGDVDDWNLAMQVLRLGGGVVSDETMRWDIDSWDEKVWG